MSVRAGESFRATVAAGLAQIREEFQVPTAFPPEVERAAADAVARGPKAAKRRDLSDVPFVTLDPAGATDLDQAFALESDGDLLVLRYAIADVAAFVEPDSPLDRESWRRGTTVYLPDAKAPVYPTVLSEGGASLLPDGPRPAIVLSVAVDPEGVAVLRSAERATVQSRAKLAYESVAATDLSPLLGEFARRVTAAEDARGASRVEFPEQEVVEEATGFRLDFRERRESEDDNATLSLAANLAVAATLYAARTGLFRTMAGPDEREVRALRRTANGLGVVWRRDQSLADLQRSLTPSPAASAFLLAARRAGGGAGYEPYQDGVVPWHAAIAATYVHATAPLRRLADRYVLEAAVTLSDGRAVPEWVTAGFAELPEAMRRADERAAKVDRAVVDLVEAATLQGHEGETFAATVTDLDERGARIQLATPAVVARLDRDDVQRGGLEPGSAVRVRLTSAEPEARRVVFVTEETLPKP